MEWLLLASACALVLLVLTSRRTEAQAGTRRTLRWTLWCLGAGATGAAVFGSAAWVLSDQYVARYHPNPTHDPSAFLILELGVIGAIPAGFVAFAFALLWALKHRIYSRVE
jgi:hypothetical protein